MCEACNHRWDSHCWTCKGCHGSARCACTEAAPKTARKGSLGGWHSVIDPPVRVA